MMLKRIAAILLALCVLFSVVFSLAEDDWGDDDWEDWGDEEFEDEEDPADSFKHMSYASSNGIEGEVFGDFIYLKTEDGDAAVITKYTGEEADLVIPETVDDLPVVEIGPSICADNPFIETVEIPGTIPLVGNSAFARCPNLKSAVIGEGVTTLCITCFGGCLELEDVQLPDSLEVIEPGVFCNCPKLQEVTFGSGIQTIGSQAFYLCASLVSVTIPEGDEVEIAADSFESCHPDIRIIRE